MIEKLLNVQSKLKAPKGNTNKFGNYKYRSCEDILEAVKPLLHEEGLVLLLSDSIESIEGRFYVKATAIVTDGVKEMSVTAYAREEETKKGMDGSQITGSSSSYARKYALNGLFAIDDTKDADATNTHDKEEKKKFTEDDFYKLAGVSERYKNAQEAIEKICTKYTLEKKREDEIKKLYDEKDLNSIIK